MNTKVLLENLATESSYRDNKVVVELPGSNIESFSETIFQYLKEENFSNAKTDNSSMHTQNAQNQDLIKEHFFLTKLGLDREGDNLDTLPLKVDKISENFSDNDVNPETFLLKPKQLSFALEGSLSSSKSNSYSQILNQNEKLSNDIEVDIENKEYNIAYINSLKYGKIDELESNSEYSQENEKLLFIENLKKVTTQGHDSTSVLEEFNNANKFSFVGDITNVMMTFSDFSKPLDELEEGNNYKNIYTEAELLDEIHLINFLSPNHLAGLISNKNLTFKAPEHVLYNHPSEANQFQQALQSNDDNLAPLFSYKHKVLLDDSLAELAAATTYKHTINELSGKDTFLLNQVIPISPAKFNTSISDTYDEARSKSLGLSVVEQIKLKLTSNKDKQNIRVQLQPSPALGKVDIALNYDKNNNSYSIEITADKVSTVYLLKQNVKELENSINEVIERDMGDISLNIGLNDKRSNDKDLDDSASLFDNELVYVNNDIEEDSKISIALPSERILMIEA